MGAALEVRGIKAADNLVADVDGDIKEVDGVLRISEIRLCYRFQIPADVKDKVSKVLQTYADKCPAYQSVKDCIRCTWEAEIIEG